MVLIFIFYVVDGSFNKQFKDMLEVEKYFGLLLCYGYVSLDGVQWIFFVNEEVEEVFSVYCIVVMYDEIKFYDDILLMLVYDLECVDLVDVLKKNVSVFLGDGKFVMCGFVNILLVFFVLCEGEVYICCDFILRCWEDCVVQIDDWNGFVFIIDLCGEVLSVGELVGWKMQDVIGGYLLFNRVYDDESGCGFCFIYSVIVGFVENVCKVFDDFYVIVFELDELISFELVYLY